MRTEIVKIGKHSLIYGFGMILSKSASFIMLPVYTRYLTPADYGMVELLTTTIDIIAMIAGIGLTATIFKYYAEYENPEEKKEVISTAMIMIFTITFITSILGILFSFNISNLVFGQAEQSYYFRLIFITYFLQQGVVIIPLLFIRALQNAKLFVLIGIIKLIIHVSLNIYFLVVLNMGLVGILYSSLLGEMTIGLYLFFYTFRSIGFRFSGYKAKKMVIFGYPFVFTSLSSFILTFSDRYFLNAYTNLETIGIYALAYKFGFLMSFLAITPFNQVWESQRFEITKQDEAGIIFKKVFLYFNIVMISFSLLLALFVRDILMVMADQAYWESYKLVPIVIVAYIFHGWTLYCNFGLYYRNRSNYLALSSVIAALCVTALNFILIPKYGAYGAAWATIGAFFLHFILVYAFSQKYYLIDYCWSKQITLLTLSISLYLFSRILTVSFLPLSLGLNAGLVLLFGIIVYRFILEEKERTFIKQIIKKSTVMPTVSPKLKM